MIRMIFVSMHQFQLPPSNCEYMYISLLVGSPFCFRLESKLLNLDWYQTCSGVGCPCFFVCCVALFGFTNIMLFSSSVRAIVALNLHSYGSGRNPWGNLKPNYLEKVSSHGSALCSLSALSGTYYLIFICYNDAWKCICCTQMAPPSFGKESMLSFCFFVDFFL